MMGQNGASLQSSRRIYRRELKKLIDHKAWLAAKLRTGKAPGLVADLIQMGEGWCFDGNPPVGTLKAVWKQVCEEARRAAAHAAKCATAKP